MFSLCVDCLTENFCHHGVATSLLCVVVKVMIVVKTDLISCCRYNISPLRTSAKAINCFRYTWDTWHVVILEWVDARVKSIALNLIRIVSMRNSALAVHVQH